jgi:hypothetical protein
MNEKRFQVTIGRALHAITWVALALVLWGYRHESSDPPVALEFALFVAILAAFFVLFKGHIWVLKFIAISLPICAALYFFVL